ncbi:F-box protein [Legionella anisa]|uniref:F-box domain-containing protein n=1 Tax=Legionella anisa TaxID=28082 RepID=A0AAX0WU00_9GAMM|nr:F-box protein [Legionella anisa]AWN75604.1 hypothetical protein DLD14_18145 [Legionella anisa]KTC76396.1 hypothetical protein Lani_0469 [Legionella anisa]MBN5934829.1 F-box protein [Legionella anisa]MCW8424201.1 F-box protein [Legionella anisa]MCW8446681.1 F-box protein [Legionella anisa]
MPINSVNTKNNEDLNDVSGAIDAADTTDGSENRTPQSLFDMCTALIAKDPSLSLMMIRNNDIDAPHINDALIKITPFIQLLPNELKCEFVMFLPVQDWKLLRRVSHEWRQVVNTAAKIFLNQVERDNLPVVRVDAKDFDAILKKLLANVGYYAHNGGRRGNQVQEVRKLAGEASSFIQPLEKLMYCNKKVKEIQRTIDNEYEVGHMLSFFRRPNNSQLYEILKSFLNESQDLIGRSPWLQKIKFCASLYPQHAITKRLSEVLLEIKGQKSKVEEKSKPKQDIDDEKQVFSLFRAV